MALDQPPIPPTAAPVAAIVVAAPQATEPIVLSSNGYKYTITGNTLLYPDVVVSSVASGSDPKAAVGALHAAYLKAGYFLATLIAKVDETEVNITVVEGRITEAGVPPDLEAYFNNAKDREDVNRNMLMLDVTMAEAYAVRQGTQPRIQFAQAAEYGGSKMTITEHPIDGFKPWSAVVAFNNFGNRYSSRYVAQANGTFRPGAGVELSAGYAQGLPNLATESKGSTYAAGSAAASIVTPWGFYNLTYNQSSYRFGDVVSFLNPEGDNSTTSVGGTQLLYADETTRIGVSQTYSYVTNKVVVPTADFVLTDQKYDVASLGVTFSKVYALVGQPGSLSGSFTFQKGLSPRDGTFAAIQPGISTPRFNLYQASLSATQSLPAGFSVGVSLSGQFGEMNDYERLPSNQQWVLGGFGNLTAWYPGIVSGDSGYLGRMVANGPSWNWWELSVSPSVFVEAGGARTNYIYPDVPNSQFLSDYGIGLTGTAFKRGTLNLAYAWPWRTRDVGPLIVNDSRAGLYFNVALSF